jgi:hypothetical protein
MIVKSGGHTDYVHLQGVEPSLYIRQIPHMVVIIRVMNGNVAFPAQNVYRSIAVVHVEVKDVRRPDLAVCAEVFQGYGHIVEIAEPPAVIG